MPRTRTKLELDVSIDTNPVESETLARAAGAYVLTLSSTLPMQGIELHSTYTGHPGAAHSASTHLALAPGRPAELAQAEHLAEELPVLHARERCLLDHALRLGDLIAAAGAGRAAIDLPEAPGPF